MVQLIDTSVFIELERRGMTINELACVASDQPVALASITASELLVGVHRANTRVQKTRRSLFVEKILEVTPVFPFDLAAARIHAKLGAFLTTQGKRIGAHDLIIAATALANNCSVLTGNAREFNRVPDLNVTVPGW